MDARAAESQITTRLDAWLQRERESGRFYDRVTVLTGIALITIMGLSAVLLTRPAQPGSLLSPPFIAVLLVANLIPAIALMVLISRKVATRRAEEEGGLGSARLHTRMVALFSVIAAAPTVLVAIFASLLLQSGLEFWFSDRARNMLENTVQVARSTYQYELDRVANEASTMAVDLNRFLQQAPIDAPQFNTFLAYQTFQRSMNEAAIVSVRPGEDVKTLAVAVGSYGLSVDDARIKRAIAKLKKLPENASVDVETPNRVAVVTRLAVAPDTFLYVGRVTPEVAGQINRADAVLADYQALLRKSRSNQLKFNIALFLGALVIVGLAILAALKIADRMVRPVGELIGAAGRIEAGDFTARVPVAKSDDEIQVLASAFNRMTGRLEEQTNELRNANTQLDTRRAFIEAVLSSVTAGVIAIDNRHAIQLANRSGEQLLGGAESIEDKPLAELSPELDEFMRGEQSEANVLLNAEGTQRTLAVKRVRYQDGSVLTFDDITDQLSDQRRAAWSDIARRIAHEIKNPLTPIQLAAERLQRRFGADIATDKDTFEKLTSTIVRQVGDLRRMVDEFSNFARMPKPVFREENVHDIAKQALFLHEVAHPAITFGLEPPTGEFRMVCDRRQLGQALTNIVKNGVEAIEGRRNRGEHSLAGDRVELKLRREGDLLVIDVLDTGIGLPEDRERITEPYVTTRVRGTGLGLAIVKKIVEEHLGEIAFLDRPGGGTHVRIAFDSAKLEALEGSGPANRANDDEGNGDRGESEEA